MESVAAACDLLIKISAIAFPAALLAGNLMVGRYLGAFGQPGLSSLGDVTGYLPTLVFILLIMIVLLGGFIFIPLGVRVSAESGETPALPNVFGWLESGRRDKRRRLCRYLVAHAPGLIGGMMLMLGVLIPAFPEGGLWVAVALTGVASLIWTARQPIPSSWKGKRFGKFQARALDAMAVIFANYTLLAWVAVLGLALLGYARPQLEALPAILAATASCGVLFGLILLYGLMSAVRRKASVAMSIAAAFMLISLTGYEVITAAALRFTNLGGGIPVVYRPVGTGKNGKSRTGCLVLAAGDTRIVWHPRASGKGSTTMSERCSFASFKSRLQQGLRIAEAEGFQKNEDIRALTRDDFYGPD